MEMAEAPEPSVPGSASTAASCASGGPATGQRSLQPLNPTCGPATSSPRPRTAHTPPYPPQAQCMQMPGHCAASLLAQMIFLCVSSLREETGRKKSNHSAHQDAAQTAKPLFPLEGVHTHSLRASAGGQRLGSHSSAAPTPLPVPCPRSWSPVSPRCQGESTRTLAVLAADWTGNCYITRAASVTLSQGEASHGVHWNQLGQPEVHSAFSLCHGPGMLPATFARPNTTGRAPGAADN